VHQGHTTIVKKDIATAERRQEVVKAFTCLELQEAQWILQYLELHERRLKELKVNIQKEAQEDEGMKVLQTIPG